ncbi:MAG: flagellar biosynthesis protein FlhF [Pseudomonadota bacterium]
MQIRRFFAKDMRSALADVSRELGPDAAILSSRQIGGGVELLAAIDYDPSVLAAPVSRSSQEDDDGSEVPVSAPASISASTRDSSAGARNAGSRSAARDWQRSAADDGQTRSGKANGFDRIAEDLIARAALANRSGERGRERVREPGNAGDRTEKISPAAAGRTEPGHVPSPLPVGVESQERQSLQANWAAPGLQDLKEEVRQLRGLMQEQLQGLAWRELKQRQPLRAMLTKRLAQLELSPRLRDHYAGAEGRDVEQALATALANITRDIVNGDDAMLDNGGIYAFVGATGVGKTTTIAKLAARFALRHGAGSVALISTDSYRIAGHDQLATYARLIGCAIRTADTAAALQDALDSFVDRRLILIDTAGMSQRDTRLAGQLAALASSRYPVKQLLVLSATSQRAILQESIKQFGQRRVHGAILTKLDETTSLGAVLSVLLESRLPLMASGDGQRVPEDLRSLRGAQLVDRALKLAEQFRESPDEWLLAQELPAHPRKASAHVGI